MFRVKFPDSRAVQRMQDFLTGDTGVCAWGCVIIQSTAAKKKKKLPLNVGKYQKNYTTRTN